MNAELRLEFHPKAKSSSLGENPTMIIVRTNMVARTSRTTPQTHMANTTMVDITVCPSSLPDTRAMDQMGTLAMEWVQDPMAGLQDQGSLATIILAGETTEGTT